MSEVVVRDNPGQSRFEVYAAEALAGFTDYELGEGQITFLHTEVFSEFGGQGLAGKLAVGALTDVRVRGLAVIPVCPFIRGYLRKHPEWVILVPEQRRAEFHL